MFGDKHFLDQHFVGPKLLECKIIWTQNYLGPKIHLGSNIFWTKNYFGFISTQILFDPKIFGFKTF